MLRSEWIPGFLARYKALFNPPDWPDGTNPTEVRAYAMAWVTQFALKQITEAEADEAMQHLVLDPPQRRDRHIPAMVRAVEALRRERLAAADPRAAPSSAELSAREQSRDCPECHGTGWAERLGRWHSIPRPFLLSLFCRCPMGRLRKANDPDLLVGDHKRNHDDLQARPELWHAGLCHPSWSEHPVEPDVEIDADCEGLWWYVAPGEDVPKPIVPVELAGRVFPQPRPERSRP